VGEELGAVDSVNLIWGWGEVPRIRSLRPWTVFMSSVIGIVEEERGGSCGGKVDGVVRVERLWRKSGCSRLNRVKG
jgi:hypothetical protein